MSPTASELGIRVREEPGAGLVVEGDVNKLRLNEWGARVASDIRGERDEEFGSRTKVWIWNIEGVNTIVFGVGKNTAIEVNLRNDDYFLPRED